MTQKRLIEVTLPLEAISAQSAREKSIRHGHISTLHIWWARRPLAAMRAAIFAALVPAPESDEERQALEALIATIVDWDQVKNGNSASIEKARALIRQAFPDGPPRVLDPFMGGGATGLEALRLGCETHAVELNPVAHLIELCTLVYPQTYGQPETVSLAQDAGNEQMHLPGQAPPEQMAMTMAVDEVQNPLAEAVRTWGTWVLDRAREAIGHLYENPEGDEAIVGYLWARTVTCPNPACRAEMPLVRQWWLAKRKGRRIALKPVVDPTAKAVTFEVVDMQRDDVGDFDPSDGTSSRSHGTCLFCGQVADKSHVKAEGLAGRMGAMPLAVITEREGRGKAYRPFTDQDKALFIEAQAKLRELDPDGELSPGEPIPSGSSRAIFVHLYGLTRWRDLFNARQLLALLTFSHQVKAAYETMIAEGMDKGQAKAVATYLGILTDRQADFSTSLTRWVSQAEFIANTFSRQALPMIWDYTEVNPFSGSTGDWTGAMDWILRVIDHTTETASHSANTHQGTSTRLPYTDSTLDAVITDPPYYDAVPYADLSDFFYVWLKRSVGFLYPDLFRTPLTPKAPEIIQEPARHKDNDAAKAFYEQQMTAAFAEARRVLRPDGIFVVVFAHKSLSAWETLLQSLLDAGLVVTASWPLHTERPGRLRAHGSAALASSIFIVCRVRAAETDGYLDDVRAALAATIRERLDFFWAQGIRGADFFISAIGPSVAVFGRYSHVYNLDGSEVSVGDLLDLVQAMVSEYALDRITSPPSDPPVGGEVKDSPPQEIKAHPISPPSGGIKGGVSIVDSPPQEIKAHPISPPSGGIKGGVSIVDAPTQEIKAHPISPPTGGIKGGVSIVDSPTPAGGIKGGVSIVDAPTRYYILHRWAYGTQRIPFDDAMRLAMALGADVSALMADRGILKQRGANVHLRGPKQRAAINALGEADRAGLNAPVIDVLHRAVTLWEQGERQALADFLAQAARGREDHVRLVAQTLINILPDDDAERRLLEGFMAGRDVLPEAVTQDRLF